MNATIHSLITFALAILMVIALGIIDYETGYELGFFVFYFIPVAFVAWNAGLRWSIATAFFCALAWFLVDAQSAQHYSSPFYLYWNSAIRLVSYLIMAYTMTGVSSALKRAKALNRDLSEALNQVKQLSGLLPICASCKKIRNDEGYWEQIEKYVTDHSEASFSHGICPACMEKLYPEIAQKMKNKGEKP